MRTAGWLFLSIAIVAGLTVAVSRAAEELPASANAAPEASAPPASAVVPVAVFVTSTVAPPFAPV